MKFTKLEIENFLTIGKAEARLDDRGLVLVQGENRDDTSQDSNGAGKSSIADAVSWALYGVTARGESGNDVINTAIKRGGAKVAAELDDAGTKYRVERTRLRGKGTLELSRWDAGEWHTLTKGTVKLTQALLEKILGCSADVFANAIYAGQEKMPDLPGMTDKMLKLLIEEAAGINRIESAYKVARERLNDTTKQIAEHERSLVTDKHWFDDKQSHLATVTANAERWDKSHATKIKDAQAELREAKATMEKAQAHHATISKDEKRMAEERQAIYERLDDVDQFHQAVTQAERELSSAQHTLKGQESDLLALKRNGAAIKTRLERVEKIVGTPCDACGKPHTEDDIEDQKTRLKNQLRDALESIKTMQAEIDKQAGKVSDAQRSVAKAKQAVPDTSTELKRAQALSDALNAITKAWRDADLATKQVREKMMAFKKAKAEANPYTPMLGDARDQVEIAKRKVGATQDKLTALDGDLALKKAAVQVFGPAGVRAHILDTVTPFLNERTNHYLGHLTDGNVSALWSTLDTNAKGEVKEKFAIAVQSKVGAKTFKGLSGGEKRKVRLACSMALQDLVSSRATKPVQLYIADEIDHALDESGLERLMGILESKASDRGTVLVISHNSLSDWIRQQVTVVKEGGKSRLEGGALA